LWWLLVGKILLQTPKVMKMMKFKMIPHCLLLWSNLLHRHLVFAHDFRKVYVIQSNILMEMFDMACLHQQVNRIDSLRP
jgi:hypothetical protein